MRTAATRLLAALAIAIAVAAAPATADAFRLVSQAPVAGNPAERLAALAPDVEEYDGATRCLRMRRPGMERLIGWIGRHAPGTSWGTYRCELWEEGKASLHAEGRALDWALDVRRTPERQAARRLIELLLAPDLIGTPHALARRMGVQEIIWDCSYWSAGMDEFDDYDACLSPGGLVRRRVDPSVAHRNHLHVGMTKAGAMGRTSFWEATAAARRARG